MKIKALNAENIDPIKKLSITDMDNFVIIAGALEKNSEVFKDIKEIFNQF